MQAFAQWSVRHRWWVIGGWAVVVLALVVLAQVAGGATFKNNSTFSGYDSQDARVVLEQQFPQAAGDTDQIAFHTTTGRVTDSAVQGRMEAMFDQVARLPHVLQVADPYSSKGQAISPDGQTAYATVMFDAPANQLSDGTIQRVIDTAEAARTSTLEIGLGGQAIEQTQSAAPGQATTVGLGVAVLVLLILFGSVTAMLMPILTALIAIAAGISVNALISHVLDMNTATEAIALMIALGVGVDYSLFIVSRFRGMLAEGKDPKEAAVAAVNTSGRAVLFAGCLVILALLGMLLLQVAITNGIAVASTVEVAFTVAAALTLLPAVLSLLGHKVNALRVPGRHPGRSSGPSPRLEAWNTFVHRMRWPLSAGTVLVLVALSVPVLFMRLGSSDAGTDAPDSTTYKAYTLIAEGFGPGANGPLVLAVTTPAASEASVLDDVVEAVGADPGVGSVGQPRMNETGTAAVLQVYPTTSPQSEETSDLVHRLRDSVLPKATEGSGLTVHVGGPTATFIDLSSLLGSRLLLFIAVVVVIGFVVLLALFRSIAIPITAAVMNLLSISAALGVVVAVFQFGWTGLSEGPVQFALPVMMFAIVFGLSTDYQVFLLTRIQEEWNTWHDNTRAVREGMVRVGGIITGAAFIMIAVFSSFVLGGQRFLQEIGVGLAVAVALDAFLIRFLLVPAVMFILGDLNWKFPRRLEWLPRIHVEPEEPPAAPTPEPLDDGSPSRR